MKWEFHEGPYRGSLYGGFPMIASMAFLVFGLLTLFLPSESHPYLFAVMLLVIAGAAVLAVVGWWKRRR